MPNWPRGWPAESYSVVPLRAVLHALDEGRGKELFTFTFEFPGLYTQEGWNDYMKAYEDALEKCSTEYAPWIVVPADHKWYRNWVISDLIVRTLEKMDLKYPAPPPGLDKLKVE